MRNSISTGNLNSNDGSCTNSHIHTVQIKTVGFFLPIRAVFFHLNSTLHICFVHNFLEFAPLKCLPLKKKEWEHIFENANSNCMDDDKRARSRVSVCII